MRLMKVFLLCMVILFPMAAACGTAGIEGEQQKGLTDRQERLLFQELNEIRSFGIIAVSLVGDAEKIGLSEPELATHVKERFKECLPGFKYDDISGDSSKFMSLIMSREKKVGNLTFRVWVVGDEYPLAYHVRCDAGNFENPAIWTEEILGHGSNKTAPDAIREILSEMIRGFAECFYRVRSGGA